MIASGSFDSSIGIWKQWHNDSDPNVDEDGDPIEEEEDWRLEVVFDEHESEVKSVAWNAGGNLLASCSRDKSVLVWEEMDDKNFETIAVLQDHEGDVKCVVWHPEEDLLASSSYDNEILLYREVIDDWEPIAVLKGHYDTVWSIDFSSTTPPSLDLSLLGSHERTKVRTDQEDRGSRLVSGSADGTIRTWTKINKDSAKATGGSGIPSILRTDTHQETWEECADPSTEHDGPIYSIAWSKITGLLVSAGHDGRIIVYQEEVYRTEDTGHDPASVDEGDRDHAEHNRKRVLRFRWRPIAEINQAHGDFPVNHVTWTKNWRKDSADEEVIVSSGQDGVVKLWSLAA